VVEQEKARGKKNPLKPMECLVSRNTCQRLPHQGLGKEPLRAIAHFDSAGETLQEACFVGALGGN